MDALLRLADVDCDGRVSENDFVACKICPETFIHHLSMPRPRFS